MHDHAVFFDPSHRRWWWIKRIGTLLGLLAVLTVSFWLVSLFTVPLLPGFRGITEAIKRGIRIPAHRQARDQYLQKSDREHLLALVRRDRKRQLAREASGPLKAIESGKPIVAAFYAPWQETGLHSLDANANRMTHLLPVWVHLRADANGLDFHDWDPALSPHNLEVVKIARANNLNIVPVFSNAQVSANGSGEFDPKRVHVFLNDPALQQKTIFELRRWCTTLQFQGINVDFENLDAADYRLLIPFLQRMKTAFAQKGLLVSVDLEAKAPLDWRAVSSICDFVIVMAYDEHSENSAPGPIASISWYRDVVQRAVQSIPRQKLVVGIANYSYDWMEGREWAEPLTYQGALVAAHDYRQEEKPEDIVDFDPEYLNPTFRYKDDDGKEHEVWMLDAVTAANQWLIAQNYGVRGMAVWVLGSTDPSIWKFVNRDHLNDPVKMTALSEPDFPYDVEFVGEGEIAHVDQMPTQGSRSLEIDPQTGLALDESYHRFPTSYVISRTGYKPKLIALTIDDGPASPYTADMLDELKALHVPATFFLIGQNAERYPNLVRRIWNEGHEIGNHTYTHPNIGVISKPEARLELNATQRVFQSLLHRSTLLFRPPYNADAEPTAAMEVQPIVTASELNYITVLEFIDTQDWNTAERMPDGTIHHRKAEDMWLTVKDQLVGEHGSCILLHDGGGDRTETVRLIPILVNELHKLGYTFVPVSALIDSTRDKVNPPVNPADTLMAANDRIVFEAIYLFELFLGVAFVTAIILGTARIVFVTILALIAKWRERHRSFDASIKPTVSVVIAAFNEETVIARTIRAVLENNYAPLEIIVVDDGSSDDTSGAVRSSFGDAVTLLVQSNTGKASALNLGIAVATGEIIIALDADTLFARDTIEKLVRHFTNPLVGAVAGNVKVGNRMNPLTHWQSIEYVTSQNLDRRAYAIINSVTVVPGAVGAWRREAILQAGGYSTDTMAEDMDLTWRIRRIGWRIETESAAVGYTEAPDSFKALFKQRFRWAFGTLQSLWKHRRAIGRYGWFGRVMLPTLWLFQVAFQVLSPLIDLQILWSIAGVVRAFMRGRLAGDWQPLPSALSSLYLIGFMYAFFFVMELIGSLVAYKLDREDPKVLVWLFWQRFLYRQLMYAVVLKSIKTAISGMRTGWGKLERKGTVEMHGETPPELQVREAPLSS
ncbi:MAG: peptidoglycan-N-acetylglucosamine deacetylase [Thermoanaerobaculia bacterium]|jgi:cellulose synthase/poly-beta-1,6-N-acetylglucosamine synthase-like glycosyltransferase/spore germination protein YaaH/peptidoglycan/xylan/chitin deacetylase (PgdA/CDA1 family)|nr:peptidoglycan-N-acetylglucosamine deacetylase [Thermoanaerobaculia bacterium]